MEEKKASSKKPPARKTLMQLQSETTVRDPAAHAKNQITELDKTAKRSLDKRSKCTLQIEEDTKELAQIEEQIQRIKHRYVGSRTVLNSKSYWCDCAGVMRVGHPRVVML